MRATFHISARRQAEAALAAAMEELARQAATDALTGLANRGYFDGALERAWRRANREPRPLALLMLDADCFKLYNDDYGHLAGDAALRAIAACIKGPIRRPGDTAARYGGEEFAVILPNTHGKGAAQVAETTRTALAELGLPHARGPAGVVTVSIGVATFMMTPDITPALLIASADAALYAAKTDGRNGTVRDGVMVRRAPWTLSGVSIRMAAVLSTGMTCLPATPARRIPGPGNRRPSP